MEPNILKRIFFDEHDHWDRFSEKHKEKLRPNVKKEVEKFRKYGDLRLHLSGLQYVEEIPLHVVRNFDAMDAGDPAVPPQFRCEECGGGTYPEYYRCVHGYE